MDSSYCGHDLTEPKPHFRLPPLQPPLAFWRVEVFLATTAPPEPATHKYLFSDRSVPAATFAPRFYYVVRIPDGRLANPKNSEATIQPKSSAPERVRIPIPRGDGEFVPVPWSPLSRGFPI